MYKDKEKQKEYNRIANQRLRDKQKGITEGITEEGITDRVSRTKTQDQIDRFPNIPLPFGPAYYAALSGKVEVTIKEEENTPALLHALADPIKRAKLRRICEELRSHNQLKNVYYGCGDTSVPFDAVSEYLAVLT